MQHADATTVRLGQTDISQPAESIPTKHDDQQPSAAFNKAARNSKYPGLLPWRQTGTRKKQVLSSIRQPAANETLNVANFSTTAAETSSAEQPNQYHRFRWQQSRCYRPHRHTLQRKVVGQTQKSKIRCARIDLKKLDCCQRLYVCASGNGFAN